VTHPRPNTHSNTWYTPTSDAVAVATPSLRAVTSAGTVTSLPSEMERAETPETPDVHHVLMTADNVLMTPGDVLIAPGVLSVYAPSLIETPLE
jgi:hypothetical protein